MSKRVGFSINGGRFSYAEFPVSFDAILGVTGTLNGLRDEEKKTLEDMYDIRRLVYIPSVYGANKLKFAKDSPRGMYVARCYSPCRALINMCFILSVQTSSFATQRTIICWSSELKLIEECGHQMGPPLRFEDQY